MDNQIMEPRSSAVVPTEEDIQEFIIAIKSGSFEKMKEMLDHFRESISNRLDSQIRQPPLYFAVINADENLSFDMVRELINAGANPNFRDANEQTIMFYICRDGKKKIAQFLIERGCKLDEEDLYGQTPIYYAASQNRIQMLDLFTKEMINHVDQLAKQTPLYYAARKGHLEMCKALVEKGCDLTHHDSNNKMAVDYAKKARFVEVADYLSSEMKKIKQISKVQNQSVQQSSQNNENSKKKKKESLTLNNNKNNYKITVMKDNGELHDLTEEQMKELYKTNPEIQTYLTNPDSIPQQILEMTLKQSWEKSALKVLTQCWKLKGAFWFYEPVDPVKYGIMDYFDIITRPIDLGTIKKKLTYNGYKTSQEYVDDMRLVWANCYKYNGPNHEISTCAKEVQTVFQQAIKNNNLLKPTD